MVNWHRFTPSDFEYDFERDKLAAHHVTFEEAVECFFSDFEVRRNKSFRDRYPTHRSHCGRAMSKKRVLSEEEIDELVTDQADDEAAWDKPVCVPLIKNTASKCSDVQLNTSTTESFPRRVGSE
jgi:hypothetical protein